MNLKFEISNLRLDCLGGWWRSLGDAPAVVMSCAMISCWSGCAAVKPTMPWPPSQPPAMEAKALPTAVEQQAALRQFEERRDAAQLGAALDRWKLGDAAGSEALLLQLLARNPAHQEARRTLADLYVAKPDPGAALELMRRLLEEDPADAQAHHSLGLLLDSQHRRDEALRHLAEAYRLEPENELYALSLEACGER